MTENSLSLSAASPWYTNERLQDGWMSAFSSSTCYLLACSPDDKKPGLDVWLVSYVDRNPGKPGRELRAHRENCQLLTFECLTDRGGPCDPSTPRPLHAHLHFRGPLQQSVHLGRGQTTRDTSECTWGQLAVHVYIILTPSRCFLTESHAAV